MVHDASKRATIVAGRIKRLLRFRTRGDHNAQAVCESVELIGTIECGTTFLTPPEFRQQVGFVVYPAGGEIKRHVHRPLEKHSIGTSEVFVLRRGRCEIDIYNDDRKLIATRTLHEGDVMLMVGGGRGFRMLEDIVFLEIKQGPYTGRDEKEYF